MKYLVTVAMRLLSFSVALAVTGTFFLPWLKLDGLSEVYSGADLMVLSISPWRDYFFSVNPLETGLLIGTPMAMLLFTIIAISKYVQGKPTPIATTIVLASALALIFGTKELVASDIPPYPGLLLATVLAAILFLHQALILLQAKLWQKRKFPVIYRALGVVTGQGRISR